MKKTSYIIIFFICYLLLNSIAYASSIDYRGNQSADYVRTLNRNAALDAADLVVYNPAGAAMVKDGFHLNAGWQSIIKTYTMETSDGTEYESDYPSLFLPNLYGIYKFDNSAIFFGLHIPAGGGTLHYEDGIAGLHDAEQFGLTTGNSVKATSIYGGLTIGAAQKIMKILSVSVSGRYIYVYRKYEAEIDLTSVGQAAFSSTDDKLELDAKRTAVGFGFIFGLNIMPIKQLNIGMRYETKTRLDQRVKAKEDTVILLGGDFLQFRDGARARRDLPAVYSLGISYDAIKQLRLLAGITYFFIKQANVDHVYEDYDNGYDASVGVEVMPIPKLVLSAGYMYSDTGANEDTVNDFDLSLDSHNFSLGAKYSVTQNTDLSLGFIYIKYTDLENADESVTFKKSTYLGALGINVRF